MRKVLLFVAALFLSYYSKAYSYHDAIELLKANKHADAISELRAIQKSGSNVADASLALALIEANDEHYGAAFDDFEVFFDNAPNPYPYVYAFSNSGIFTAADDERWIKTRVFLTHLLDDPKAGNTIQCFAAYTLGRRLEDHGNIDDARKMYAKIHDVKNWGTVGAFENASASGFNKDFGVLAHPEPGYNFTNKNGATVNWFDMKAVRNDRWHDFEYHYYTANTIIYAQSFVTADEDMPAILLAGVSGSLKIWVNDYLVGQEREERNTDQDVYNYRIKLQKGVNRILVQVGESEINRSNFLIRLSDTAGKILDLKSDSHYQPYVKAAPYNVEQLPLMPEQYFKELAAKNPDDLITQILLLEVYNHNEKEYEAQNTIAAIKKIAPQCTLVSKKDIETANTYDNEIEASKEAEFVKTNDSESLLGLKLRCAEAIKKEDYTEAYNLLQRRIQLFGANSSTEYQLLNILGYKKDLENLPLQIDSAYQKYPDDYNIMALKYTYVASYLKNAAQANEILKDYAKNNFNSTVLEEIASENLKAGQNEQAKKIYENMLSDHPVGVGYCLAYAGLLSQMKDYDAALKAMDKAIEIAPYRGDYYYKKGLIYELKGQKDSVLAMMQKAVYYESSNYEARKKLRELEGKTDLMNVFKKENIKQLYSDAIKSGKYDKADGAFLLNDSKEIVYPENGASEEQRDIVLLVNTKDAIDENKELSIPYNSYTQRLVINSAEILKKDGSVIDADINDNAMVFSSLEAGDAIYISYKLENSYFGKLSEHFWNSFTFNSSYPVQIARFSLLVPAKKKFNYKVYNATITPEEKDIEDYKLYVWEKQDVPKIESEPFMATDYASERIAVSSIPDWDYVAKWYEDISSIKTKPDFEIKAKVKELLAGNEHKPDLEKAKIIYNYIEKNMHYSNVSFLHSAFTPQRASKTLNTKLGDCKDLSTLFVSMAHEAGLNANLVLVDTKENEGTTREIPTIDFNHCIVQLQCNQQNYFIEMTNNYNSFGVMGHSLLNANCVYIPNEQDAGSTEQLRTLTANVAPVNATIRNTKVSFKDKETEVSRGSLRVGSAAADLRYSYKNMDDSERRNSLLTELSNEFNKEISLDKIMTGDLNNLSDTVRFDYNFKIKDYCTEILGMQVFKLPWSDVFSIQQMVSLDHRNYPIDISYFAAEPDYQETITVAIPTGKKLVEMPKNVKISCPAFNYSVSYAVKNNRLTAVRKVRFLEDLVMPAAYEQFKNDITAMNNADKIDIGIK